MQKISKTRNRELFLSMFRSPKDNAQALAYFIASSVCTVGVVILNFIR